MVSGKDGQWERLKLETEWKAKERSLWWSLWHGGELEIELMGRRRMRRRRRKRVIG